MPVPVDSQGAMEEAPAVEPAHAENKLTFAVGGFPKARQVSLPGFFAVPLCVSDDHRHRADRCAILAHACPSSFENHAHIVQAGNETAAIGLAAA